MSKKFAALIFLTVANALLLIHSIIPHHHHDIDGGMSGAVQTEAFCEEHFDMHEHHDDGMLSDILSEFPHASHYLSAQSQANNFRGAELTLLMLIVPECAFILNDYVTKEISFNIVPDINYSFSTVHRSGLRAPPAF